MPIYLVFVDGKNWLQKQLKDKMAFPEEYLKTMLYQLLIKRSVLIVRYNTLYPLNLKILNNWIKTSKLLTMITVSLSSNVMKRDLLEQKMTC